MLDSVWKLTGSNSSRYGSSTKRVWNEVEVREKETTRTPGQRMFAVLNGKSFNRKFNLSGHSGTAHTDGRRT